MSRGRRPSTQSQNSFCALSPSSAPSDGCQIRSSPKSVIRSTTFGSSAFRNDMVFPLHAPPWSHSTDDMGSPPEESPDHAPGAMRGKRRWRAAAWSAVVELVAERLGHLDQEAEPAGDVLVLEHPQQREDGPGGHGLTLVLLGALAERTGGHGDDLDDAGVGE